MSADRSARMARGCIALTLALLAGTSAAAQDAAPDEVRPAADDALTQLSRRLSRRLDAALADPALRGARVGMAVRDLETGRVLYTRGAEEPLAPASNQKLLTAAAVQALLGPEQVLYTQFRADRLPDAEGRVGTLHVVGGGDPSLTVEGLYAAARAIAQAGVRRVDAIVADDSYFEGPGRPPSWPERNFEEWYGAPSSALGANFNVVAVHARGTTTGQPGEAWVDPFPTYFELRSELVTGRGPWGVRSEILPAAPEGGPVQLLTVRGRVAPSRTYRELRAVEDPALFCAHGVAESLRRVGVEVAGPARRGRAPEDSVLLHAHASKPLGLLVHDMNKESSNVFAETLLQVLGAELVGRPGTREKGLAVMHEYLCSASVRTAGCKLLDGSGLSPENRLTANAVADLLLTVAADPYSFPEFLVSLPVGGIDGTLRRRLDDSPARRLIRAKTGRIDGAVALSGLARVESGTDAVFSLLVNGYHCPTWKAQDAVDRVVEALVADVPPAPDLRARVDLTRVRGSLTATAPPQGDEIDGSLEDDADGN